MEKRVFVVLNMLSSRNSPAVRQQIIRSLEEADLSFELYEHSALGPIKPVVERAIKNGVHCIVAAGGDGTVSAVASMLVGTPIPLVIIPLGTGNALAYEFRIPFAVDAALRLIKDHDVRTIDAMQVEDRHVILIVGAGVLGSTMKTTLPEHKRRFGRFAYVLNGLRRFAIARRKRFTVTVDGQVHQFKATEVFVANAAAIGQPPFHWGTHVIPDDGVLDICVIRGRTLFEHIRILLSMLLNMHRQMPRMTYLEARKEVIIDCELRVVSHADGEIAGRTPITVKLLPQAVHLFVPRKYKRPSLIDFSKWNFAHISGLVEGARPSTSLTKSRSRTRSRTSRRRS